MNILARRLPIKQDILYVLSGVLFVVYAWAIHSFLFQLSSWLLNYQLGEILGILSYTLALALLESLLLLGLLLLIALLLPSRWFKDGFAYKGFLATLVAAAGMFLLRNYLLEDGNLARNAFYLILGIGIGLSFLLGFLFQHVTALQRFLLAIEERLQVFNYLFLPAGILGLVVVFLRNL